MFQVLKDSQSYYMLIHPQCVGGYLVENYAVIKELICLHQNAYKVSQSLHWDLVKIGKVIVYSSCTKFIGRERITFFEKQRCCFFQKTNHNACCEIFIDAQKGLTCNHWVSSYRYAAKTLKFYLL